MIFCGCATREGMGGELLVRSWRLSKGLGDKSNSVLLFEEWKASFKWVESVDNAGVDPAGEIEKARMAAVERLGLVAQVKMSELVG